MDNIVVIIGASVGTTLVVVSYRLRRPKKPQKKENIKK